MKNDILIENHVKIGDYRARLTIAKEILESAKEAMIPVDKVCADSLLRTLMEPKNDNVSPSQMTQEFLEIYKCVLLQVWLTSKDGQ